MNILALADTLERAGMDIADDVIQVARVEFDRPPSSAQIHAVAGRVRNDQRPALPPTPFPTRPEGAPMPDWIRDKFVRFVQGTDAERAVAKARAEERELAEKVEASRRRLASLAALGRMQGICRGTGEEVIEIDGKRVCPDCGVEVPDIEVRMVRPTGKRRSWRTGEAS